METVKEFKNIVQIGLHQINMRPSIPVKSHQRARLLQWQAQLSEYSDEQLKAVWHKHGRVFICYAGFILLALETLYPGCDILEASPSAAFLIRQEFWKFSPPEPWDDEEGIMRELWESMEWASSILQLPTIVDDWQLVKYKKYRGYMNDVDDEDGDEDDGNGEDDGDDDSLFATAIGPPVGSSWEMRNHRGVIS